MAPYFDFQVQSEEESPFRQCSVFVQSLLCEIFVEWGERSAASISE